MLVVVVEEGWMWMFSSGRRKELHGWICHRLLRSSYSKVSPSLLP
jgi:hypothetical protein